MGLEIHLNSRPRPITKHRHTGSFNKSLARHDNMTCHHLRALQLNTYPWNALASERERSSDIVDLSKLLIASPQPPTGPIMTPVKHEAGTFVVVRTHRAMALR